MYTVVPYLVKFIDSLTNIYVRYNRKRLKGKNGREDTAMALATLHHVLVVLCKTMSPFTPFFTENMYQNLKKVLQSQPDSLHWCDFPLAEEERQGDTHIEESVRRMQSVIEIVRQLRTKHNRSVKTPLKEITVVHVDDSFLSDISGELQEYVADESNVQNIVVCNDPLKYASLKAVPDWRILGKKLGKRMGSFAKSIQSLPHDQLVALKDGKSIEIEGESISPEEVKIMTEFMMPEGFTEEQLDAAGDGEVLVLVDLRIDDDMIESRTTR